MASEALRACQARKQNPKVGDALQQNSQKARMAKRLTARTFMSEVNHTLLCTQDALALTPSPQATELSRLPVF